MNIKDWFTLDASKQPIDLEDAQDVEIVIREDGKTLWINAPICIVRFCRIKGEIKIEDKRKKTNRKKK
jgi:hypothetical protein